MEERLIHFHLWKKVPETDYRLDKQATAGPLEKLEDLRWLFANLGLDPRYREWFQHRAWVRTIHGTTRIEGNSLNDLEVEEVLEKRPATRSKDALEVLATRSALAFVDEIASHRRLQIDERVIREIHKRVIDDIDPMLRPGEFRTGENKVGDAEGNIIFATALSGDVPDVMHRFGRWLREGARAEHPAVAAALAHLELVAIHPFYDGNGRTARALSRLLLVRHGFALDGLVSLDAYLDLQRRDYFAAIRASLGASYVRGYDATPFVRYCLQAISAAAEHVCARRSRPASSCPCSPIHSSMPGSAEASGRATTARSPGGPGRALHATSRRQCAPGISPRPARPSPVAIALVRSFRPCSRCR